MKEGKSTADGKSRNKEGRKEERRAEGRKENPPLMVVSEEGRQAGRKGMKEGRKIHRWW